MAKNLVIVESPSKAKTIKGYLGKNYNVMASVGHLRDLPKSQLGVDVDNDFEPKYITIRGKGELLAKLKKEAKGAQNVYLATDPDREGEAISWHLAQSLNIDMDKECRVAFNEITKNAVKQAMETPRKIDKDLVDAQQARRILDRIVGYKLSPLLWKKVKKGLSAGRVQSTATRLVVDREREVDSFIPEEYWNILATLYGEKSKGKIEAKFHGIDGKKTTLRSKGQTEEVLAHLEKAEYIVKSVKYGEKKKSPVPPFITSTLQQEASRRLGFSARRTMSAAQKLYEGINIAGFGTLGLITYMRTDSLRISNDALDGAREYIKNQFGAEYLPAKPRVFKSRKSSQDAHEAIRPTTPEITPEKVREGADADSYRLYKLIWERFIACQMENSVYETASIDIDAAGCLFKASSSKLKFKGFEILYIDTEEKEEKKSKSLPKLAEGEKLKLDNLAHDQNFTEPPSRYTEASLIKTLEEKGIGRPSTYAPTITTILARGYVVREKRLLYPTELGIITTDLMKEHFSNIIDVEFTAGMEEKLDEIEEGKAEWVELLRNFYTPFSETLKNAEEIISKIEIKDEESDVQCEKCGRTMVYKQGRFGKFLACPGFPECRNAKPIIIETGVNCPKCGGKIVERKSKRGKKYFTCENSAECGVVLWDQPTSEVCDKCGSVIVEKGYKNNKKTICSNKECGEKK